jgi:hypothetical protein
VRNTGGAVRRFLLFPSLCGRAGERGKPQTTTQRIHATNDQRRLQVSGSKSPSSKSPSSRSPGLLSIRGAGLFRSVQSSLPPKEGILVKTIGHESRFVPVEVLPADEREVLSGRHAETPAERPDELG